MLTLASPAKLNLFLRVLDRRSDGYHHLASLLQTIDLCDTLHFALGRADHLTCSSPAIPTDSSNLVFKAAALFRQETGLRFNLEVHLHKRIPHEAGLGGGSSNAATTLWALNELLGRPVAIAQLTDWAARLGSDVPFFLSQGTAFCTGRGERLQSLPPLPPQSLWVVKPLEGISTREVYRYLNLATLQTRDPQHSLQQFLDGAPEYYNDLEATAFSIMPKLYRIKRELQERGYSPVVMSGSGSSLFCAGPSAPTLPNTTCFPVSFINRSPNRWYTM